MFNSLGTFSYNHFYIKLPIEILKALIPSPILIKFPAYLNVLYLITYYLDGTIYDFLHCETFSTPPFSSILGSCLQIPLACVPPLNSLSVQYNR